MEEGSCDQLVRLVDGNPHGFDAGAEFLNDGRRYCGISGASQLRVSFTHEFVRPCRFLVPSGENPTTTDTSRYLG